VGCCGRFFDFANRAVVTAGVYLSGELHHPVIGSSKAESLQLFGPMPSPAQIVAALEGAVLSCVTRRSAGRGSRHVGQLGELAPVGVIHVDEELCALAA